MNKKLSNTADREVIERYLGKKYRFPRLYQPHTIINGTEESLLSVITMNQPDRINYAIWGMLPEDYQDDWFYFQNAFDTLTIDQRQLLSTPLYKASFTEKRCLIVVTGFFSYHLHKGVLYPYHVYKPKNRPFCLAGVYTILDDGFVTCSILTQKVSGILKEIQNVNDTMPKVIPKHLYEYWLNPHAQEDELLFFLKKENDQNLIANPIAKELFNHNISFDSMLEPVHYKNIPGQYRI